MMYTPLPLILELELYRKALKEIAHFGYQCMGYAIEMQQIAEKALRDGERIGKDYNEQESTST